MQLLDHGYYSSCALTPFGRRFELFGHAFLFGVFFYQPRKEFLCLFFGIDKEGKKLAVIKKPFPLFVVYIALVSKSSFFIRAFICF